MRRENSLTTLINGLPVEQVIGDLTQPETIENAVKGVDVVFHNGALLGGRSNLALALQITTGGTRTVAEAARKAGARRMVHMSSVAALGAPMDLPQGVGPMILDETHTWNWIRRNGHTVTPNTWRRWKFKKRLFRGWMRSLSTPP